MHDARQIANWFIHRAGNDTPQYPVTNLIKLAYIAHGWHLEQTLKPLFRNRIEAWKWGPVIPDIYNAFRQDRQGRTIWYPATHPAPNTSSETLLEYVHKTYGSLSGIRLSNILLQPDGAWDKIVRAHGYYAPIADTLTLAHFRQKRKAYVNNNI